MKTINLSIPTIKQSTARFLYLGYAHAINSLYSNNTLAYPCIWDPCLWSRLANKLPALALASSKTLLFLLLLTSANFRRRRRQSSRKARNWEKVWTSSAAMAGRSKLLLHWLQKSEMTRTQASLETINPLDLCPCWNWLDKYLSQKDWFLDLTLFFTLWVHGVSKNIFSYVIFYFNVCLSNKNNHKHNRSGTEIRV